VGFRMVLQNPERVESLIVQDAVAHNSGLRANWKTRPAFWADRPANEEALRGNLLSLTAARSRHVGDDPNLGGDGAAHLRAAVSPPWAVAGRPASRVKPRVRNASATIANTIRLAPASV